jgi:Mn-dependent DtxR family transcriptional regulator
MGQTQILQLLKKYKGKWLATSDIVDMLKLSPSSISNSLRRLTRQGMVDLREGHYFDPVHSKNQRQNEYRWK